MSWKYHDQTFIPKSPEEIWPFISTLDGYKKWYIRDGHLDYKIGGEFYQVWNEQIKTMCTVDEIIPNERFAFRWKWTIDTRIDIWLEREGNGTYVHIEHGEFPEEKDFEELFFAYIMGWTKFLMCLKCFILTGIDIRDDFVW